MTVGETIRAKLMADAATVALVGTKVFPNQAPQGTAAPYVVFQVVSDVPEDILAPDGNARLTDARIQIDCYAAKYKDAHAIATAISAALEPAAPDPTLGMWRTLKRDLYDNEAQLHRVFLEFAAWS